MLRPPGWHAAPLLWTLDTPWLPSGCVSTLGGSFLVAVCSQEDPCHCPLHGPRLTLHPPNWGLGARCPFLAADLLGGSEALGPHVKPPPFWQGWGWRGGMKLEASCFFKDILLRTHLSCSPLGLLNSRGREGGREGGKRGRLWKAHVWRMQHLSVEFHVFLGAQPECAWHPACVTGGVCTAWGCACRFGRETRCGLRASSREGSGFLLVGLPPNSGHLLCGFTWSWGDVTHASPPSSIHKPSPGHTVGLWRAQVGPDPSLGPAGGGL